MVAKVIDGQQYLRIGEVAELIKRRPQTIKRWYQWAEAENKLHLLPPMHKLQFGNLQVAYWKLTDIKQLEEFRDKLSYGDMSGFNLQFWGDRGRRMKHDAENETHTQ